MVRVAVRDQDRLDRAGCGERREVAGIVRARVDDTQPVAPGARSTHVLVPSSVIGPGFGARTERRPRWRLRDWHSAHLDTATLRDLNTFSRFIRAVMIAAGCGFPLCSAHPYDIGPSHISITIMTAPGA